MKRLYKHWIHTQFVIYGIFTDHSLTLSQNTLIKPPDELWTIKGTLLVIPVIIFMFIECIIRSTLKKNTNISKSVLNRIIPRAFDEWFDRNGFLMYNKSSSYERYLYYKYYYKSFKWSYKYYNDMVPIKNTLDKIKAAMEQNKRDYMTLKLAGIKDQEDEEVI